MISTKIHFSIGKSDTSLEDLMETTTEYINECIHNGDSLVSMTPMVYNGKCVTVSVINTSSKSSNKRVPKHKYQTLKQLHEKGFINQLYARLIFLDDTRLKFVNVGVGGVYEYHNDDKIHNMLDEYGDYIVLNMYEAEPGYQVITVKQSNH